jgi:S-adenosylmethionine:tRNA ribosyltransferase-isomerase
MRISDFDYVLPPELIAQRPLSDRAASRMLILERTSGHMEDALFRQLPQRLRGDELIVVNNARVIPARLFGYRRGVHAEPPGRRGPARKEHLRSCIEVLLTRRLAPDLWEALVRPGRKIRTGERLVFEGDLEAEVVGRGEYGVRQLRLHARSGADIAAIIDKIGHVPLPPYIRRSDDAADREAYQTLFASSPVAVAAPTAGLHFTPEILRELREKGVEIAEITLEVGLGTFQPIRSENLEDHSMHCEAYEISEEAAFAIESARRQRRLILAVGTTVVRALEDAARKSVQAGRSAEAIAAGKAYADIFIRPGHQFSMVDQLLTNFHLPRSTLLVLVCAFAGRDSVLAAYKHAVSGGYRFYSYGDCMLIR